jgi:uncharacterized protein YrrD
VKVLQPEARLSEVEERFPNAIMILLFTETDTSFKVNEIEVFSMQPTLPLGHVASIISPGVLTDVEAAKT